MAAAKEKLTRWGAAGVCVLLVLVVIGAVSATHAVCTVLWSAYEEAEAEPPERFTVQKHVDIDWDNSPGVWTVFDVHAGVEYLVVKTPHGGLAICPIVSDGQPRPAAGD